MSVIQHATHICMYALMRFGVLSKLDEVLIDRTSNTYILYLVLLKSLLAKIGILL